MPEQKWSRRRPRNPPQRTWRQNQAAFTRSLTAVINSWLCSKCQSAYVCHQLFIFYLVICEWVIILISIGSSICTFLSSYLLWQLDIDEAGGLSCLINNAGMSPKAARYNRVTSDQMTVSCVMFLLDVRAVVIIYVISGLGFRRLSQSTPLLHCCWPEIFLRRSQTLPWWSICPVLWDQSAWTSRTGVEGLLEDSILIEPAKQLSIWSHDPWLTISNTKMSAPSPFIPDGSSECLYYWCLWQSGAYYNRNTCLF